MKITIRKKKLSNGNFSLYLDIYHLGKRKYEFLNLYLTKDKEQNKETKLLAEKIRANREVELQNNVYGFVPDFKKRVSFIKYFENILTEQKKWSGYHSTLFQIKEFNKHKDLSFMDIDEKWLKDFQKHLLDAVSQNSANTYYQILKRVLKRAKREKIIITNPADYVDNIKYKDVKRGFLTVDELETLAKTDCQLPEVKRAFLFACFTGLRFSDIKNLKGENVKEDHLEVRQQKTQDIIYIPLSETAKHLLFTSKGITSYLPDTLIFNLPEKWFYNEILKRWFKKAEINKNAHSHLARHTFATLNITKGANIFTVSKLLGHKNLKTTEIYSKLIDEKKKEAINNLPIINFL